jgi:Aldo/keto reductase family
MEMRVFGRTGMRLSVLGFGCGAVGGLMVRGDPLNRERSIARAIAAGVNYFDTAVQYGNGESEKNLGRILQQLKDTGPRKGNGSVKIAPALPVPTNVGDARPFDHECKSRGRHFRVGPCAYRPMVLEVSVTGTSSANEHTTSMLPCLTHRSGAAHAAAEPDILRFAGVFAQSLSHVKRSDPAP